MLADAISDIHDDVTDGCWTHLFDMVKSGAEKNVDILNEFLPGGRCHKMIDIDRIQIVERKVRLYLFHLLCILFKKHSIF